MVKEEAKSESKPTFELIKPAGIRRLAKKLGRRISPQFLLQVEISVRSRVEACARAHNGGKKTMDWEVASIHGFKIL